MASRMPARDHRKPLFVCFRASRAGAIASWNATAERLLGHRIEQAIGRRVTVLFHSKERGKFTRALAHLRSGEGFQQRLTCVRKDGAHINATVTVCAADAAVRNPAAVCVLLQISQPPARLHRNLEENLERFRRFFQQVPVGLYRSTMDGRLIEANPTFVHMLGYPDRRTLLATNALNLYVDAAVRELWIARLKRDGVVTDFESELRRYDGSRIWVRATARIVSSRVRRAPYLEGMITNITEHKRAEAERAQRVTELEVFYTTCHKLRTAYLPAEMYLVIVEQAKTLLGAAHGCLSLLQPDGNLARVYTVGIPTEQTGSKFSSVATPSGHVVTTGQPFVTTDVNREPWAAPGEAMPYSSLGPLTIVPVRSEDSILGTLCVAREKSAGLQPFTDAEVRLLEGMAEVAGIAIRRATLYQNLQDAYVQMVVALAQAMEIRDSYTAGHGMRMVELADRIAGELGCTEQEIADVRWAARLHDIGKIGIGDAVLRKPTNLSNKEWAIMKQHPILGEEILNSVERMRGVALLVRHHQERWDGTGYPDGLRGDAIPLGARILAVVDAYGAMTETRPYRTAMSQVDAVEEIRRCAGTQFDPRIVEVFLALIAQQDSL